MGKLIALIVAFATSFSVLCQFTDEQLKEFINNSSKSELIEKNTVLSLDGNYYQAGMIAEKLLELEPMSSNFNYRMGIAQMNTSADYAKSAKYLEIAAQNTSKNYDVFSTNEKAAPIDAILKLGWSYHLRGEIDKAIETYNTFLEKAPKKSDNIELANLKIQQCKIAKDLINNPLDYEITNLGAGINSRAADYAPVVSLDGSSLYFTSRRVRKDSSNLDIKDIEKDMYLEDVYVVYRGFDDEWGEPVIMDFCDAQFNEATTAISIDERRIYIYKDEFGNGDVYYSDFKENDFKDFKKLEAEGVNTEHWEPHISVSPNGKFRFFVSNRPGGYGGRDIYRIEKLPNGEWSEPMNLGPTINTEYDEDAPFLAVDNKTLYFSSNGTKSMGGFDVFRSQMDDLGQWTEPTNLGVPLNTTGDDIYYTTTMDGFTGYLSSFRPNGQGEKDIYEIKNTHLGIENIAGLKGDIETTDGSEIPSNIAYTLNCLSCEEDYKVKLYPRVNDGRFYASLFPCETYEMSFYSEEDDNVFYQETFSTNCEDEYQEIYRKIVLDVENMQVVIPKEDVVFEPQDFKHYFAYNKNGLSSEEGALKEFLEEVIRQHEAGREEFVISLESSASKVTTKTFKDNYSLAKTRADQLKRTIVDYLSSKNIDGVAINIADISVNGPEYSAGDKGDIGKYAPFQYVKMKLEGLNQEDPNEGLTNLNSKDKELADLESLPGVIVSSTSEKTNADSESVSTEDRDIKSIDSYHVIAGVFKYKRYASEFVEELNSSGYSNSRIIGKRNGMYTVSVDAYNSVDKAQVLLDAIRSEINSKAWILAPF